MLLSLSLFHWNQDQNYKTKDLKIFLHGCKSFLLRHFFNFVTGKVIIIWFDRFELLESNILFVRKSNSRKKKKKKNDILNSRKMEKTKVDLPLLPEFKMELMVCLLSNFKSLNIVIKNSIADFDSVLVAPLKTL